MDTCTSIAEEVGEGRIEIYTSTIAMVELIHLGGGVKVMNKEKEDVLAGYFRREWIRIVQLDTKVATLARQLIWRHGLKAYDATHAASALIENVPIIETYDEKMI